MNEPSPALQLEFIERFQRLLDSGSFVATYKYALLIALCNIAAEQGYDDNRAQRVELHDLGRQFLSLYWTHARTYPGFRHSLRQNSGKQAAILSVVEQARASVPNPDRADAPDSVAERYVRAATTRVRTMPLWKLQTLGVEKDDPDHPDNFLYPARLEGNSIVLRPGISACLRRFRSLIVSTTQTAWSDYIRRQNPELGPGHDLDAFLFGTDRVALHQLTVPLLALQDGKCFYSGRPLDPAQAHVDHFVPWAKYPLNSPFNLVVASNSVNLQKSDHLAALPHLARWFARLLEQRTALVELGALPQDHERALEIARFTYGQAERMRTLGWLRARDMQDLTGWRQILAA